MHETDAHDDLVIERTFDAPVEVVWAMWTEPEHFRSWYGPMGATVPVAELDVRVGGERRVCMAMETPNGPMEMWFVGVHLEVVDGERLVYTEAVADEHGRPLTDAAHPETRVQVELAVI